LALLAGNGAATCVCNILVLFVSNLTTLIQQFVMGGDMLRTPGKIINSLVRSSFDIFLVASFSRWFTISHLVVRRQPTLKKAQNQRTQQGCAPTPANKNGDFYRDQLQPLPNSCVAQLVYVTLVARRRVGRAGPLARAQIHAAVAVQE
jgi:hypothetical protein